MTDAVDVPVLIVEAQPVERGQDLRLRVGQVEPEVGVGMDASPRDTGVGQHARRRIEELPAIAGPYAPARNHSRTAAPSVCR